MHPAVKSRTYRLKYTWDQSRMHPSHDSGESGAHPSQNRDFFCTRVSSQGCTRVRSGSPAAAPESELAAPQSELAAPESDLGAPESVDCTPVNRKSYVLVIFVINRWSVTQKIFACGAVLRYTYLSLIFMIISYMDYMFYNSCLVCKFFRESKISPPQAEFFLECTLVNLNHKCCSDSSTVHGRYPRDS